MWRRKWREEGCGVLVGWFLSALLLIPFLDKPVHIDDANFLVLAEGAGQDPWRPHAIPINWTGRTQPAFEVLSNPPGMAWWLLPVRQRCSIVRHLWVALWLIPGTWGARRLFGVLVPRDANLATWLLMTSPVVVWATQSLTPDLPLLACTVVGVGLFLGSGRTAAIGAIVAGTAALFRYSGLCLVPLLMLAGWQRRRWRGVFLGSLALIPFLLLALHDLHAYGEVHFLRMIGFQLDAEHRTVAGRVNNAIAFVAMLGGVGVLPVVLLQPRAVWGALVGCWLGGNGAWMAGHNWRQAIPAVVFTASGGAVFSLLRKRHRRDRLLAAWLLGGFVFLLGLRFAAARYWIPFLPAAVAIAVRSVRSRVLLVAAVLANVLVAWGLAQDDYAFARAHQMAALRTARMGTGTFSGHWGWQHYLEAAGWRPVERYGDPGRLHAVSAAADPQRWRNDASLKVRERFDLPARSWRPRVHSVAGAAGFHSNLIGGRYGAIRTFAPWTFACDPYDTITIYERRE